MLVIRSTLQELGLSDIACEHRGRLHQHINIRGIPSAVCEDALGSVCESAAVSDKEGVAAIHAGCSHIPID